MRRTAVSGLALLVLLAAAPRDLAEQLDLLHDDPFLQRSVLATQVVVAGSGEPVHARNADKLLTPASTVKLVTAMAVLERLPLDHVLETPVAARGTLRNGVLNGDLVIVGAGDPSLGSAGDPFGAWADALVADGLRRVRGDIVGDDRLFTHLPLGPGWMWDDATDSYSAPVTALVVAGNTVTVRVRSGAPGQPAVVSAHPCLPVEHRVETGPDDATPDISVTRLPSSPITHVRGVLPPNHEQRLTITVPEPASCAALRLSDALSARGVEVDGRPRRAAEDEPEGPLQALAWHRSPPLRDLLRHMLVMSDNLYAESLIRLLDPAPRGRDFDGARPAVAALMRAAAVPDDAWRLVDGSGLSRYDQLTAEALVRLLRYGWRRPWREDLLALLPSSGEGTLRARLVGGPAAQRVQAKTGSMTGVFNIAGYVVPEDGEPLVFAMLSNGVVQPGSVPRYTQDAALHLLAAARPAPAPVASTGCGRR